MEELIQPSDVVKHLVALDIIVFGFDGLELKLLLCKPKIESDEIEWLLPTGFLRENESLDEAAKRVLTSFTQMSEVFLNQLYSFVKSGKNSQEAFVSVVYLALTHITEFDQNFMEKSGANWFPVENHPHLTFDHEEIGQKAIHRLRQESLTQPIGFELLPSRFTITQVQNLYEAIFLRKLDKRNFRKKLLSMNFLEILDIKDKNHSKKGAFLYHFNQERYETLTRQGFRFDIYM
jgi:8-oxo-dGTP diphosphatase